MHEAGGEAVLVVRCPDSPIWGTRAIPLTPLVRIRNNKLCEGWKCPLWNSPTAFRRLPQDMRVEKGAQRARAARGLVAKAPRGGRGRDSQQDQCA